MGCNSSCNANSSFIKSIQIITESGKTFMIAYDKELKISQIKNYMEMRIASKSDTIRLYIKIENDQSKQRIISDNNLDEQIDYKSKVISEGGKQYKKIELEDNMLLENYQKLLSQSSSIYLSQDKSLKSQSSNESVTTTSNSNRGQRNQTICVHPLTKSDVALKIAIEKLESGEQMTQSQMDIIQNYDTTKNQFNQYQANSPDIILNFD